MRLPWPTQAEVERCDPNRDTLTLLRWKNHLPYPTTEEHQQVSEAVVRKLEAANTDHVEVIAKSVGYAA